MSAIKLPRSARPSRCSRAAHASRYLPLALAALAVGGCGAVKVQPSTPSGSSQLTSRGRVDSPLTSMHNHLACLRQAHLAVRELSPTKLQIGAAPAGPTVTFAATPGIAQGNQIDGQAQGAEVIGSALLYPNRGSASELSDVETCLALGVAG
jgi:hypothetical protein